MYSRRYNVRSKQPSPAVRSEREQSVPAQQSAPHQIHENVMELLVAEEVQKQLQTLPPKLAQYVNPVEVETYALNRLPPLYASSEEGWKYQQNKGHEQLHKKVRDAVRQGFSAVQQDPIRLSTPLRSSLADKATPKIAPRQPLREDITEQKQRDDRWKRDQYYRY